MKPEMSVPDWPVCAYGYNMFLFPPSRWIGGIFYEHTHRLWATVVGLLTTILAVWLLVKDPRKWMKWLGVAAFLLVIAQGVNSGGLRVVLGRNNLGSIHGVVGQTFFVLVCAMALFTSDFWRKISEQKKRCARLVADPCSGDDHFDFLPVDFGRDRYARAERGIFRQYIPFGLRQARRLDTEARTPSPDIMPTASKLPMPTTLRPSR